MASESGWTMPKGDLMKGKKGLIMGVANSNSIAWGIASQLAAQGAELAFTYLGEGLERRVRPLAESVGAKLLIPADVTDDASMDAAFAELEKQFGTIDFVVHSVAFANKDELKGSFVENTSRDSFLLAMNISAFSFVDVAKRASRLMPNGGSLVTMTYLGSERAIPNYNTMGVAKAALEAATRYIARDLGPKGIRVNAISAGAMRTACWRMNWRIMSERAWLSLSARAGSSSAYSSMASSRATASAARARRTAFSPWPVLIASTAPARALRATSVG